MYPAIPFIAPPGTKDFAEAIASFEKNRDAQRKQYEQERAKREEEFLKTMAPQQVAMYKAQKAEVENEEKQREARYSNPCQPLVSLSPRP
jgi:hypothetical protein